MRAVRPEGWKSTLLYNTAGPGTWEMVSLEATLKAEGGLAKRVSLIHQPQNGDDTQPMALGTDNTT